MLVQLQPPTIVYNNKVTVTTAGTRVVLGNANIVSVTVTALSTNANVIYLGNAGVTSANGDQIKPGSSRSLDIDSLGKVWIDAASNGDAITFIAVG